MKFSAAVVIAVASAASSAAASPVAAPASDLYISDGITRTTIGAQAASDNGIAKRATGSAKKKGNDNVVDTVISIIEVVFNVVGTLNDWNSARETFTQKTTRDMMNSNRDPANVAAVCYNKGYRVENQGNVRGLTSAKLTQGVLSTDYDCMYLQAPNAFWTDSDGGFINVSSDCRIPHKRVRF
jgi:hypothetical protein